MNIRYECALLKNISQGTPVIPVFAAEMTPTGDFIPFDIKRASAALPHVQHARQASASNMIAELRYSLLLSFFLLPVLLSLLMESTLGARFHQKKHHFSIAFRIPSGKYLFLLIFSSSLLFSLPSLSLSLAFVFVLSYLRKTSDSKKDIQAEGGVPETKRRGQGGTGRPRSKGNASHAEVRLTHHRFLSTLTTLFFWFPPFSFPSSPPLSPSPSSPLSFLSLIFLFLFCFLCRY